MKRHLLTATVLLSALGFYAAGLDSGAMVLIALGAGLEAWFWIRVTRASPRSPSA